MVHRETEVKTTALVEVEDILTTKGRLILTYVGERTAIPERL